MISNAKVTFVRTDTADLCIDLPRYETSGAAGMDLRANLSPEYRMDGVFLAPMQRALIPTGLRIALPDGCEMQIRPRSGLALKQGITVLNAPGTIDSDYRGEVQVLLVNFGDTLQNIAHGSRIAQGVVAPVISALLELADTLPETGRGAGGFGSTGIR